jgi:curli biogenesis system outer membrane secretion channel CsgG
MRLLFILFICLTGLWTCSGPRQEITHTEDQLIPAYTASAAVGPKKKLAVTKFENTTRFGQQRLGDQLTDVLSTELSKTNRFILMERSRIDQIMEQVALSQSGITEGNLQQMELLDADYIITGAVTHYAVSTSGSSDLFSQKKIQKAEVAADMRIIDLRSGEVILSETGRGTAEREFKKVMGMGEEGGYDESLEMVAFRTAVVDLSGRIVATLDKRPWLCDVVKTAGRELYIDAGRESNLNLWDTLHIYQKGELVTDLNGQPIGYREKLIDSGVLSEWIGERGALLQAVHLDTFQLPLFCRLAAPPKP